MPILPRSEIDTLIGLHADEVLYDLNKRFETKAFTPFACERGEPIRFPKDPWRVYILYDPASFRVHDIVEIA